MRTGINAITKTVYSSRDSSVFIDPEDHLQIVVFLFVFNSIINTLVSMQEGGKLKDRDIVRMFLPHHILANSMLNSEDG